MCCSVKSLVVVVSLIVFVFPLSGGEKKKKIFLAAVKY